MGIFAEMPTLYLLFKDGHIEKIIPFLPPDILIPQCEIVSQGLPANEYLIITADGEYKAIERFIPKLPLVKGMKPQYEYFKKNENGDFVECKEIISIIAEYEDGEIDDKNDGK